jgi:hypothetical protein
MNTGQNIPSCIWRTNIDLLLVNYMSNVISGADNCKKYYPSLLLLVTAIYASHGKASGKNDTRGGI